MARGKNRRGRPTIESRMHTGQADRLLMIALGSLTAVWVGLHVLYAQPSGDEGWYLYAARGIWEGRWPFFQAFFTQGPLAALVIAPSAGLSPTLLAGRGQSALVFGVVLWLGARWLRRENSPAGVWVWLLLLGLSTFIVHMNTLVLTTVYELLAVTFVLRLIQREHYSAAAAVAGAAAALRLSLAAWAFVVWLALTLAAPRGQKAKTALRLALSGGGAFLLLVLPCLLAAPERTWEGLLGYHLSGGRLDLSPERAWENRLLFWKYWLLFLWPILAAAAAAWAATRRTRPDRTDMLLLLGAAALTLAHSLPVFPYPKYQAAPVALVALFAARRWGAATKPAILNTAVVLVMIPLQLGIWTYGLDHLRWEESPPLYHHRLGRTLRALAEEPGWETDTLLTFDTLLAVEGRLRVPAGYEMGVFSLTINWDDARARRIGTVTPKMVVTDLASGRYPLVALHEQDLGLAAPADRAAAEQALAKDYSTSKPLPNVGHDRDNLFVFRLREPKL